MIGASETQLFRAGLPLFVVLSLPPVIGYIWRGVTFGEWGWGVVGLIISAGFTCAVCRGLVAHTTECNSKINHRYEKPVRYWLTITVWFAAYVISVAAFFVEHTSVNGAMHR
jgi:hypothetical protein